MAISRSLERLWDEYNDYFENELHLDHWDQGQRMEALFNSLKKWKYKIIQKKNKHIGFVMWGEPLQIHKEQFSYQTAIHEAYIKPEYRHKGIMTEQINYIVNHPMFIKRRVCLFVLNQNQLALSIWKKIFNRLNFSFDGEITRDQDGAWYGFSRD